MKLAFVKKPSESSSGILLSDVKKKFTDVLEKTFNYWKESESGKQQKQTQYGHSQSEKRWKDLDR